MSEIKKMILESDSPVDDRLDKLKELMPEVFTESGIDFDKLRLELGDEVDEGQERYAFTWPGKADAIRQSQTVSTATLRPCVEKSRSRGGEDGSFDSDNIYIEGDNLEVLKLLQRGYHGKVKMIYIDPPTIRARTSSTRTSSVTPSRTTKSRQDCQTRPMQIQAVVTIATGVR